MSLRGLLGFFSLLPRQTDLPCGVERCGDGHDKQTAREQCVIAVQPVAVKAQKVSVTSHSNSSFQRRGCQASQALQPRAGSN